MDTSIVLDAVSRAPGEPSRAKIARDLLRERDLALPVQVLQELSVQATRPSRADRLRHDQAVRLARRSLCRYPVQELTLEIVEAAFASCTRSCLSFRDAAILEAARPSGCEVVLSENLSGGEDDGGVRVVNPFSDDG